MKQILHTNGSYFREGTMYISTVKLPLSGLYETCLFSGSDSEILETYTELKDAVEGHQKYRLMYHCYTPGVIE